MDQRLRQLEKRAETDPDARKALDTARARVTEGRPKMVWDRPELKLADLTKEQLIAHCERQAAYYRVHGDKSAAEFQKHIQELEHRNYQLGYILDKIWDGLAKHGGMDPKTYAEKEPKTVVNAFWNIVGKLGRFKREFQEVLTLPGKCVANRTSSNNLVSCCLRPTHQDDQHHWSMFYDPKDFATKEEGTKSD